VAVLSALETSQKSLSSFTQASQCVRLFFV